MGCYFFKVNNMAETRKCIICGTQYNYCPHCGKDPSWKLMYDTEECRQVGNIVSAYNMKVMSKERAMNEINNLNIRDFEKFDEKISKVLTEITTVPKVEEPAPAPVEVEEERPRGRRRRRYGY